MAKEIRIDKTSNFTVIDNVFLQRKDMTLKAKGLLAFMLSLPADWDYSIKGLTKILREGLDGIRATINELENLGYMTRGQDEWVVREIALENPTLENPALENPTLENPTLENPTQINKQNKQRTKKEQRTNVESEVDFEKEFQELWSLYPKKRAMQECFMSYAYHRKDTTFEEIKHGLLNYLEHIKTEQPEHRFIKTSLTWFNKKAWSDVYVLEPTTNTNTLDRYANGGVNFD